MTTNVLSNNLIRQHRTTFRPTMHRTSTPAQVDLEPKDMVMSELSDSAKQAIDFASTRIETELKPVYTYHNFAHTFRGVLPAVLRFGEMCDLDDAGTNLVAVAAAYHDIGFLVSHIEHEMHGAEMAGQILPQFGFDPTQVEKIQGMIMATKFPQAPLSLPEQILADADLDVLGREDFLTRNLALHQELCQTVKEVPLAEWFVQQGRFLEGHEYFTDAARELRGPTKAYNIRLLKSQLELVQ